MRYCVPASPTHVDVVHSCLPLCSHHLASLGFLKEGMIQDLPTSLLEPRSLIGDYREIHLLGGDLFFRFTHLSSFWHIYLTWYLHVVLFFI